MKSNRPTKKGRPFQVRNPGSILVLWDIFFGLPIAYILTQLNEHIFQYLGYEKFMKCSGGTHLNQSIFVLVNTWLVVGWGWQLMQEAKAEREENIRRIKMEIRYWDKEIERLQGLLDIEEQLKDRTRAEIEGGEKKLMENVDGEIWFGK